jgi:light-regulated signal transduction histidine kinase (bacteriophytochrome)
MILDTGSNKVITSENFVNDEQNFKIGNLSVILEILHSKLYSNPMKAMIQEIISNAVDANKENNQENTPIEITFPNVFSNSFSIKDNGIGIDKNRMADIFINYGSSTKRNTNDQIGCLVLVPNPRLLTPIISQLKPSQKTDSSVFILLMLAKIKSAK